MKYPWFSRYANRSSENLVPDVWRAWDKREDLLTTPATKTCRRDARITTLFARSRRHGLFPEAFDLSTEVIGEQGAFINVF